MPGLIRAGAVDPPVKPAKSGRAGRRARLRGAVASVAQRSRVCTSPTGGWDARPTSLFVIYG